MKRTVTLTLAAALGLALTSGPAPAEQVQLRAVGTFSGNKAQVDGVERPFYDTLAERTGIDLAVNYNPADVLGVKIADALRLVKSGAFDVIAAGVGNVAGDESFLEGVDIAGLSTDLDLLRKAVGAYREEMNKKLEERFNARVMTLWPFGPQVFFCATPINGITDLKGKKVRTYTASMALLVKQLGGTAVTLEFSEVYPALQRGVADCAITAPSAGNNAKWTEVTDHFFPLSIMAAVTAHFMNLDTWNKFTPDQQEKLEAAYRDMEDQLWDVAKKVNEDASNCNVGREPCEMHEKYDLQLVEVTPPMIETVKKAAEESTVPAWAEGCTRVHPDCAETWNRTVGEVYGITIQ
jgi:TRAP-type C4-dicarboxylate transport system substrate-binding protein